MTDDRLASIKCNQDQKCFEILTSFYASCFFFLTDG